MKIIRIFFHINEIIIYQLLISRLYYAIIHYNKSAIIVSLFCQNNHCTTSKQNVCIILLIINNYDHVKVPSSKFHGI